MLHSKIKCDKCWYDTSFNISWPHCILPCTLNRCIKLPYYKICFPFTVMHTTRSCKRHQFLRQRSICTHWLALWQSDFTTKRLISLPGIFWKLFMTHYQFLESGWYVRQTIHSKVHQDIERTMDEGPRNSEADLGQKEVSCNNTV